jgi:hypothetical protein
MNRGHTYPCPLISGVSATFEALVVYLRLRTVNITLTSKVLDVLDVVAGGGGGSAIPVVGMLPANIEVDSAHMNTTAVTNFFMVCSMLL